MNPIWWGFISIAGNIEKNNNIENETEDEVEGKKEKIVHEEEIIFFSNTNSYPRTMMIKFFNTVITDIAMRSSWWFVNVAGWAVFYLEGVVVNCMFKISFFDKTHIFQLRIEHVVGHFKSICMICVLGNNTSIFENSQTHKKNRKN